VSGEHPGAQLASEIQALVEQELTRSGVRAPLRLERDTLVLRRGTTETRADIAGTLAQWESLPDDLRARRVQQIAALLATDGPAPLAPAAAARPTVGGRPLPASRALGLRWYSVLAPISIAALTAFAIAVAYRYLAPRGGGTAAFVGASSGSAAPASSLDPDRERAARASTACDQTRRRVAQGANLGPADSEGWVVELTLLRRGAPVDLALAPGLSKFIKLKPGTQIGTLAWPPAQNLSAVQRFDAEVALSSTAPLGEGRLSGLDLVFSGPYVVPYFTEAQRGDYMRLADALAEELQATEGALFARCANGESHYLGSWFHGSTPGRAVASLVYFMASYNDVPTLKPNVLGVLSGAPQRGHAFDAINLAAAEMDRSAAATLIGRELGMVSGGRDHATRLSFPFRDANRAERASVDAARSLRLANSG
jgi:hypothetical protein